MKVLVVCTGNSCRSQMADAFFNQREGVSAFSAGTHPEPVNPYAVKVMGEVGVDISKNASHHLDDYITEPFDFVITVCDNAKESCPIFPGKGAHVHHSFEDPAKMRGTDEEVLDKFREVRDQINGYVDSFIQTNT